MKQEIIRNKTGTLKQYRNQKGVTIIALVITIIVLIILAGATLNILLGENGLMKKSKDAKEETKIAELTEKLELEKGPVQLNNDGIVTLETYLDHIKEQGIIDDDCIEETGDEKSRFITVEDEYVYLVEDEENGNVKITYQGKLKDLVPNVIIKVTNTTTNSITVKIEGSRIENIEYYIKNVTTGEEYALKATNTTGEYTFTGLIQNNEYQIQIKAKNKNGTTTKETQPIKTMTIENLTQANTNFTYSPEGWTNQDVTVTANPAVTLPSGVIVQTSKDLNKWDDSTSQTFTQNEKMYVRLWDGVNESSYAIAQVSKIDKILPVVGEPETTTNTITMTATDDASGIIGYNITTTTTPPTEFIDCPETMNFSTTIDKLRQSTTYYLWVKDKAGNVSAAKEAPTKTVVSLTSANTTFTYSPSGWTNGNVTVTASTTATIPSGYRLQTSTNGTSWEDKTTQIYSANGNIYARLYDGINESAHAAGAVSKIDKTLPKANISCPSSTFVNATITATVTLEDQGTPLSGINTSKCKYVYNTNSGDIGTNESSYTGGTFSSNSQNINLRATSIAKYYLHVLVIDNAGNKKEYKSGAIDVKDSKVISNLKTGDYIYYDPGSRSYTSPASVNGMSNQVFSSSTYKGTWRVLTKTSSAVTIIPTFSVTNFQVKGQAGYNNFISELDKISTIYVHPTYATAGRVVRYSDISALNAIGATNIGNTYWLGDRYSQVDENGRTFYYGRTIVNGGAAQQSWIYYTSKSGNVYTDTPSFQIRPVITLKPDAPLKQGTGSSSNMYYLQ